MPEVATFSPLALLIPLALAAASCASGVNLSYDWSDAVKRVSASDREAAKIGIVAMTDGRNLGAPAEGRVLYGISRDAALNAIRNAVVGHALQAGLVEGDARVEFPPTTPEQVDSVLANAGSRGHQMVLFTRLEGLNAWSHEAVATRIAHTSAFLSWFVVGVAALVPVFIIYSLPINTEYSGFQMRAFWVDARTGSVAHTFRVRRTINESNTWWGFGPGGDFDDVMFEAMEALFEEGARLLKAPSRNLGPARDLLFAPSHVLDEMSPPENDAAEVQS